MTRRIVVSTPVGLGTPQGYKLECPACKKINETPDAGKEGILTADGTAYYTFNCKCGCRYKAKVIPLEIKTYSGSDVLASWNYLKGR